MKNYEETINIVKQLAHDLSLIQMHYAGEEESLIYKYLKKHSLTIDDFDLFNLSRAFVNTTVKYGNGDFTEEFLIIRAFIGILTFPKFKDYDIIYNKITENVFVVMNVLEGEYEIETLTGEGGSILFEDAKNYKKIGEVTKDVLEKAKKGE